MNVLLFAVLLSMLIQPQPTKRKLLLFGESDANHIEQLTLLKQDSTGMADRDLILMVVEDRQVYNEYKVKPNQFMLVLIGKDGSEKLRSAKPIDAETIFRLIDSMPMRQAEMSKKKN